MQLAVKEMGNSEAKKTCLDVFSYLHHGDINIPGSLSLFAVQDVFKSFICCQDMTVQRLAAVFRYFLRHVQETWVGFCFSVLIIEFFCEPILWKWHFRIQTMFYIFEVSFIGWISQFF